MPLRNGNPFYFLFSPAGQQAIEPTTLVVSDIPYNTNPLVTAPYPQSLRIQFSLKSGGVAPNLRPLGPGLMSFHFDPQPGLAPPEPQDAIVENYHKWPTVGRLRLTIDDPTVGQRIKTITGLPVPLTEIWYSNVRLTREFLFETLPNLPFREAIGGAKDSYPPGTPEAIKQVVSGFLKGRLSSRLLSGKQASEDSQVTLKMPELARNASGTFDFYVTTSFQPAPFDGDRDDYENPNSVTDAWEPAHPINGIVPARLVYRHLRTHASGNMIDADAGNPVPDRILATSATAGVPDYYPVRFTRIWKPQDDCSVHFPSQVVIATHRATGGRRIEQRLPAHGILFLTLTQAEAQTGTQFDITLTNPSVKPEREMLWLSGDLSNVWRRRADNLIVTVTPPAATQTLQQFPHVVLRRRMAQEVIYDRKGRPTSFGPACTFFSMRRTARALVNNRIAGGRLNYEVFYDRNGRLVDPFKNSATTRKLVREALGGTAADVVLDGQPNHRAAEAGTLDQEALRLIKVFEQFFPDNIVPQPGDEFPVPSPTKEGKVIYLLWQSIVPSFQESKTRRLFADRWLAGGGAGATQVVNLTLDYVVNPGQTTTRNPGETDTSFRDRIVDDMLAGNLEPGAPLQFWSHFGELDQIRTRTVPDPEANISGHSPMFLRYVEENGIRTGMVVLDQTGEKECIRTGNPGESYLPWFIFRPDAWIAANWTE